MMDVFVLGLGFSPQPLPTPRFATGCKGAAMILDFILGGAVAVFMTGYLIYPERV